MNELKRLFCLFAALSLLLIGCKTKTEYVSVGGEDSSVVSLPESSKVQQSSKPAPSSSSSSSKPKPPSFSSSQKPASSSKPVSSGSTVVIPSGEVGLHYFDNLNEAQKKIYLLIEDAVKNMTAGMIHLGVTTTKDVSLAFTAVRCDHPEYFWMPYSYINKIEGDDFSIALDYESDQSSVSYLCTKQQKKTMEAALKSKVATIKKLIPSGASDYEAELIVHDWICKNVNYVDTGDDEMRYTAYGALVNGKAICEGYSRAMQLLCKELSIPCTLVCGVSTDRGENHMWNVVKIGGEWYNLDVTWDDDDHNNLVTHRFFNITDVVMNSTHKADPDFSTLSDSNFGGGTVPSYNFSLPACTAVSYHYAAQAGCTLDNNVDSSKATLRTILKAAADKKAPYCEFYLSYDVDSSVSAQDIAEKYTLQNCKNVVNSNSKHKIVGMSIALTGRTFIVILNYGG